MHIILNSPLAPFWHFLVEVIRTVLFNCGLLHLPAFSWFLKCGHSRGPRSHLSCQDLCLCSWQDVLLTSEYYISEGKWCAPVTHFTVETLLAGADMISTARRPSSVVVWGTLMPSQCRWVNCPLPLPGEGSPNTLSPSFKPSGFTPTSLVFAPALLPHCCTTTALPHSHRMGWSYELYSWPPEEGQWWRRAWNFFSVMTTYLWPSPEETRLSLGICSHITKISFDCKIIGMLGYLSGSVG